MEEVNLSCGSKTCIRCEYIRLKEELRIHLEKHPQDVIGRYLIQYQIEPLYRELLFRGLI